MIGREDERLKKKFRREDGEGRKDKIKDRKKEIEDNKWKEGGECILKKDSG